MTQFERKLVNALNSYFEENRLNAIAYRRKMSKYTKQFCDVLVDSKHDKYYLAIENKSIDVSSRTKLYFSQHFSNNGKHQIETISDFIEKSGRSGFLAVELRRGRGKPRKAFIVPWRVLKGKYDSDEVGISIEELKEKHIELGRKSSDYKVDQMFNQQNIRRK